MKKGSEREKDEAKGKARKNIVTKETCPNIKLTQHPNQQSIWTRTGAFLCSIIKFLFRV